MLTIFAKNSLLDVWLSSEFTPGKYQWSILLKYSRNGGLNVDFIYIRNLGEKF